MRKSRLRSSNAVTCHRKRQYMTIHAALATLHRMQEQGIDTSMLNVYCCYACKYFHIGRKPKSNRGNTYENR